METWKVVKTEYVRKRPKWLVRFLIMLSPEVYLAKDSLEEGRATLLGIKQIIADTHLLEERTRMHYHEDDDSIVLSSAKDRPFIRFSVEQRM